MHPSPLLPLSAPPLQIKSKFNTSLSGLGLYFVLQSLQQIYNTLLSSLNCTQLFQTNGDKVVQFATSHIAWPVVEVPTLHSSADQGRWSWAFYNTAHITKLHIAHCWLRRSVEFLTLQPAGPTKGGEVVPRASIRRETIISPGSLFHLPPLLHSSRVTLLPVLFLKYANHRAVLLLCAILNIVIALHGTLQYTHYSSTRPALQCTLIIFSIQVYHVLLSSVQFNMQATLFLSDYLICWAHLKTSTLLQQFLALQNSFHYFTKILFSFTLINRQDIELALNSTVQRS